MISPPRRMANGYAGKHSGMTDRDKPSIADNERSPVSEAADEIETGPAGVDEADEKRPEPPGTAEAPAPKVGPDGKPVGATGRRSH